MKLEGKVAVITGAARGLGRAYALHLAKLGADVVINDVDLDAAKEYGEELTAPTVMDEIRAMGRRSTGIAASVTEQAQVNAMFDQVLSEFGRVDILVTNAGGVDHPAIWNLLNERGYDGWITLDLDPPCPNEGEGSVDDKIGINCRYLTETLKVPHL